jgi:hypothetical protein
MSRIVPLPVSNTVVDSTVSIINADGSVATVGGTVNNPTVVQGPAAHDAAAAGNPVLNGGFASSTAPAVVGAGDVARAWYGLGGQQASMIVSSTGSIAALVNVQGDGISTGTICLATQAFGARYNGTNWDRDTKPNAVSRIPSSAADTNPTSAKASAGNLVSINGLNASATVTYLKFYRKATAPTVGTDIPFLTVALPALLTFSFSFDSLYFSTGIAYGLTTDAADNGTTAVAAGAILGLNVVYA